MARMHTSPLRFHPAPIGLVLAAGLLAGLGGCRSPLNQETESALRHSVLSSVRREVAEAERSPTPGQTRRESGAARLDIRPEVMPELETMAGIGSYDPNLFPMNEDLLGGPQRVARITLERAIKTAAENNLNVQFARLTPAINEAQVVSAEAAFDWVFFGNTQWQSIDETRPQQTIGFSTVGTTANQTDSVSQTAGLRKPLTTGGQFTIQDQYTDTRNTTPGLTVSPNPSHENDLTLQFDQPLLRRFGSDVTLAQVRLNRNQERDAIAALKRTMIQNITDTERAYWALVQAHHNLQILQRLVDRGVTVRDQLASRRILDVTPAEYSDAVARVEQRISNVLRAQNDFRKASDQLKVLMNDPELTAGSEVLLLPVENTPDVPIRFSLLDSFTTGVAHRPEVQQAVLSIDNTSIRQQVADNARLPMLDLRLQTKFQNVASDIGTSLRDTADGRFVDYLAGLNFEVPIGNWAATAEYNRRRRERMQAVIAYRNTVQQIVLEIKNALRDVVTNYRLIEQTRTARLASSENLRTLLVQLQTTTPLTPSTLDLELRFQESLAASEQEEVTAQVNYSVAIAQLYAAMGTALERNRIAFSVPDSPEAFARIPGYPKAAPPPGLVTEAFEQPERPGAGAR
jgi:outer membrane protein